MKPSPVQAGELPEEEDSGAVVVCELDETVEVVVAAVVLEVACTSLRSGFVLSSVESG